MQKKCFFQTVNIDLLSSAENNGVDISFDILTDDIYTENRINVEKEKKKREKEKEKEYFSKLGNIEQLDVLSNISTDFASESPKKRALKFLGIKEKSKTCKLTNILQNKKTSDTETEQDVFFFDQTQSVLNTLELSNVFPKSSIKEESKETHTASDDCKFYIDAWRKNLQRKIQKEQKEKKYEQNFYCLKQIVWNNLHNTYDHSIIKICNIYHDNTLECLFDDLSTLRFYGKKNICIYKNANYMYHDINDHLFVTEKKERKEKIEFEIHNDIYEYLYTKKKELNQFNNFIKEGFQEEIDMIKNDNIYRNEPDEQDRRSRNYVENLKGQEKTKSPETDIPIFQFCINKYPFFLKEKMKVVTHLYNLFSIEPYINHEYIEKDMYFSNSVKTVYSVEKTQHVTWRLYEKKTLERLLKSILIKRKKNNVFQGKFTKIDNYISINFLTQEIKVQDVNTNEELKDNNYILLNGNGLCFSPYYHLLVPMYRHIQKQEMKTNNPNFLGEANKNDKNDKNETYEKVKQGQRNSFSLCYEYMYISQMFNIYDNFHISFFYPLYISYFFYYHLFVKEKLEMEKKCSYENDGVELSFLSKEKHENSVSYLDSLSKRNHKRVTGKAKETEKEKDNIKRKEYNNNEEISYLIQLEKLHNILNLCYDIVMNKKKEWYKINKDNTIQFALPSSCFEQSEHIEFVSEQEKINISMLYLICISKYNNVYYERNMNDYIGELVETWTNGIAWKRKQLCFNEIKETYNIRSLFPVSSRNYFSSCNKIDNIIKVSIRCDGVCFFYIADFHECLFYAFFIIFNSLKNMLILSVNEKWETKKGQEQMNYNSCYARDSRNNNKNTTKIETGNQTDLSVQSTTVLEESFLQGNNAKLKDENNKETDKDHSNNPCTNESIHSKLVFCLNEKERLLTSFFCATHENPNSSVLTNIEMQKRANRRKERSAQFAYVEKIFEINNLKNIYNDFYICENRKVNTFKLINLIDKKKRKIVVPYYFDKKELAEFFFFSIIKCSCV